METTKKIPQRCELAVEDTWATEDLYASDEAWEQALSQLEKVGPQMAGYAGKLAESADGKDQCRGRAFGQLLHAQGR